MGTTLSLTLTVTLISTIVGTSIAWILTQVQLPLASFLRAACIMPLAIPSYVFTFSWIALLPKFGGFFAAALVLSLSTIPYVLLAVLAGMRRIDMTQFEVARTLGLNQWSTFFKVTLPQLRNSLAAGSLLVSLYVISDFGAVSLLNVNTVTRAIQNLYRGSFDRTSAAILSILILLLALAIVSIEGSLRSKDPAQKTSVSIMRTKPFKTSSGARYISLSLILTYLILGLFLPLIVLFSIFIANPVSVNWSELSAAAFSTASASFAGAAIALTFAIPLGVLTLYRRNWLARLSERGLLVIHALPGIVLGLALVSMSSRFPAIYQSVGLLAFSYAILFLAKSVGSVRSGIAKVPANLTEISATLGRTRMETFRRINLPLATPSIAVGFLLVMLASMKELPATLMLRPTGFETLATQIWSNTAINRFSEAAPFALTLIIVAAIPTFLLTRPDKESGGGQI
jgi:iron(III) transport system permease protein